MARINAGKCIQIAQVMTSKSSEQVSLDLKIHVQTLYRLRNQSDMRIQKLHDFAEYFGMDLFEFLKLGQN
jgi:hypothetical protein